MKKAIGNIRQGNLVIVMDEDREHEADFIGAAAIMNRFMINFMLTVARGAFIAVFCEKEVCDRLKLTPQVELSENTESNKTSMLVSVDDKYSVSGSSVADRLKTIYTLARKDSKPEDLIRPGHIIPIQAQPNRRGHTEAGVNLIKLAGIEPAVAVDMEILNEYGAMANRQEVEALAKRYNLEIVTIKQIMGAI